MSAHSDKKDEKPVTILVDFGTDTPAVPADELPTKSNAAVGQAMHLVSGVAQRLSKDLEGLKGNERPHAVELSFNISLHPEMLAQICQGDAKGAFKVKLLWERESKPTATIRPLGGLIPPRPEPQPEPEPDDDDDDD